MMSIPRTGGVFEPTHNFSLVTQYIQVNKKGKFHVKFPNIWLSYKLPKVVEKETYDNWLSNQMQFWQNQLNFAVWCATSGCGVSKTIHLQHKNPMLRSVFRFHAYYQIRRILTEMSCPLPSENSFNPLNNGINMHAYDRICDEFGVDYSSNWRQKFDPLNGMGTVFYEKTITQNYGSFRSHFFTEKKIKSTSNRFNSKFQVDGDPVDYIEQLFDHDPGITDQSIKKGDSMAAIGSFVLDDWKHGFTQAGVSRLDESIRTFVWAILGSQAQTRSSILGSGKAFDAQKQFLSNVENAINSEIDLPGSIERFQSTLQYASSKLDFVIGIGLYLIPSNLEMKVGVINSYNNLIQIATEDMKVGINASVNDEPRNIESSYTENYEKDFEDVELNKQNDNIEDYESYEDFVDISKTKLTHDETKLSMILAGFLILTLAVLSY